MKFKITRPDGTIIEGEGATADDLIKLAPLPLSWWPLPTQPTITWECAGGAK